MNEVNQFFLTALQFPTVLYTAWVGLVVLYWLVFMVGLADLDVLGGVDGAADGAIDGAMDGAVEGAADGALEGAEIADSAGLLHALRLRSVPMTITLTLMAISGFLISHSACIYLGEALDAALPTALWQTGVLFGSAVGAGFVASLGARTLAPVFQKTLARRNQDLIGEIVTVKTGRVDAGFGQAEFDDGEAGLLVAVRHTGEGTFARNDRALVVSHDPKTNTYEIAPVGDMLLPTGRD